MCNDMDHNFMDINRIDINRNISPLTPYAHAKNEYYMALGRMLEICARSFLYKKIDSASAIHWLKPAILLGQYKTINIDWEVDAIGFYTWAWLSDKSIIEFREGGKKSLQPMDWFDGNNLVIVSHIFVDGFESVFDNEMNALKNIVGNFNTLDFLIEKQAV